MPVNVGRSCVSTAHASVFPPSSARTSGRSASAASASRSGNAQRPMARTRSTSRAGRVPVAYTAGPSTTPASRSRLVNLRCVPNCVRSAGGQSGRIASAQRAYPGSGCSRSAPATAAQSSRPTNSAAARPWDMPVTARSTAVSASGPDGCASSGAG